MSRIEQVLYSPGPNECQSTHVIGVANDWFKKEKEKEKKLIGSQLVHTGNGNGTNANKTSSDNIE